MKLGELLKGRGREGQAAFELESSAETEPTPALAITRADKATSDKGNGRALEGVVQIRVDEIKTNPFQPRVEFSEESIKELAASIEAHGLLQPLIVRRNGGWFELVVGERRLRACRSLHWTHVPVVVRDLSDRQVAEMALVENLQREDLNYFDEAEGYRRLITEFGFRQDELGQRLGKSQGTVANKLRLLRVPPELRKSISREIFSERHVRALVRLNDLERQEEAVRIVARDGLTVRQTEQLVERLIQEVVGGQGKGKSKQKITKVYKDLRLFENSLGRLVSEMRSGGAAIEMLAERAEEWVEFRVRVDLRSRQG